MPNLWPAPEGFELHRRVQALRQLPPPSGVCDAADQGTDAYVPGLREGPQRNAVRSEVEKLQLLPQQEPGCPAAKTRG